MTIRRLILPTAALLFGLAQPAHTQSPLMNLLPANLKAGLTPAEQKVLECAPTGQPTDFRVGDGVLDNPANAGKWDNTRTIRAEFLHWLCTVEEATKLVDTKGITISGAKIEGKLDLECAVLPWRLRIESSAIWGGIILRYARTRTLSFDRSHISSVSATGLSVDGDLFLQAVQVKGKLLLQRAEVKGSLRCTDAVLANPKTEALSAERLSIGCDLYLDRIRVEGEVHLLGALVNGILSCDGAVFRNAGGSALDANQMHVNGTLFMRDFKGLSGSVNLIAARVERFGDDTTSWPQKGELYLDGFEYNSFAADETPATAKERLRWLRLQPHRRFRTQPYEHLASVFRRMGRDTDARKVLIAEEDDLCKYGDLTLLTGCWKWLLKQTMSYGYRPWLALVYMVGFVLLGWWIFSWAGRTGILKSTNPAAAEPWGKDPLLSPFVYSLDVFLPIVDFKQADGWLPDPTKPSGRGFLGNPWGWWVRIFFWIQIALGWIFSALLVAALTGLIRTD